MIKHTWTDHPDYANLKAALSLMEQVATFINEQKREAENFQKLIELERKFIPKLEGLAESSRLLIKEGIVAGKKKKQDFGLEFDLFNKTLISN